MNNIPTLGAYLDHRLTPLRKVLALGESKKNVTLLDCAELSETHMVYEPSNTQRRMTQSHHTNKLDFH